jgi:hypothetical protein
MLWLANPCWIGGILAVLALCLRSIRCTEARNCQLEADALEIRLRAKRHVGEMAVQPKANGGGD